MHNHQPHSTYDPSRDQRPPTPAMHRLLRTLADKRGESFTPPNTRADADREIKRLKRRPAQRRADRRRDDRAISRQIATGLPSASAVDHDYETQGWGSSARWA